MASNYDLYGDYSQQQNLSQSACNHTGIGVGFALLGMAVGAALALLLAPKAGSDLRSDLRQGIDTAKNKSGSLIGNVKGKVISFRRSEA
jgi:YtxH-like protein